MTTSEVVTRARRAVGHGCVYVLGQGGESPDAVFPFESPEQGCDCSGFAAWALGIHREIGGVWYGTDQIVADATGAHHLFTALPWEQAQPADLVVFPHQAPGHHGHVGVVTAVDATGPTTVVHCSLGNWKVKGDAIQETSPGVFRPAVGVIIARFNPPSPEKDQAA